MTLVRRGGYCVALVLVCLLSAEVTARLDDWLTLGVPFLESPDSDRDLVLRDEFGTRGRPHGRFKKWQLNGFGFRGREISVQPERGHCRVVILGASEAFGLYESPGREFP